MAKYIRHFCVDIRQREPDNRHLLTFNPLYAGHNLHLAPYNPQFHF